MILLNLKYQHQLYLLIHFLFFLFSEAQSPEPRYPEAQSPEAQSPEAQKPRSPEPRSPEPRACITVWSQVVRCSARIPYRVHNPLPTPCSPEPRAQSPEPRSPEPRSPEPRSPEAQSPEAQSPEAQSPEPRTQKPRAQKPRSPEAQKPRAQKPSSLKIRLKTSPKGANMASICFYFWILSKMLKLWHWQWRYQLNPLTCEKSGNVE